VPCYFNKLIDFNCGNNPVYRTEEGTTWVLPAVRKAEAEILKNPNLNHDYNPALGSETFCAAAGKFLLGENSDLMKNGKVLFAQTLSGCGALKIGAEFLSSIKNCRIFYTSNPTWHNHKDLFLHSGFTEERKYRYWDYEKKCLDLDGMLEDIQSAPDNSVFVLQGCAHNPTGCDPTHEQWIKIAEVMRNKNIFPFFDLAYQGFASGDPDNDAFAVRYFAENGFEMFCAQSFAKNFGLYGLIIN
jgi:aspartate aminotransferase